MCGIFGYINIRDSGMEMLRVMADQQIHRGPDDEGLYVDGEFGFGLRRLSIIDLKTGNQPIFNEDGSVCVICNGEIYNYLEISDELMKEGHRFSTKSDAECIVHLYEKYGIKCLEHLNGMFGLAIYDKKAGALYVARDRLGIKPLYYARSSNGLLFASELRSILATGVVSKELDWQGLSCFLDLMYIPTPFSPFKDIKKVKAGCYLRVKKDGLVEECAYWHLEDRPKEQLPTTEEEAKEQLTYLLRDSCRLQLRADVPLCVFLSGGVDSSAVAAFAAMESRHTLRTYHVHFDADTKKIDERRYARMVAKRYNTLHEEVTVTNDDFTRLIPTLLWHMEEPFGDLAIVPTFIISEMAKKEVKVCLNGSGGDELFAGYPHHSKWAKARRTILSSMDVVGAGDVLRTLVGQPRTSKNFSIMFSQYDRRASGLMLKTNKKVFPCDTLNQIMAADIDSYLQSNILFLLDKITMAVSLEGRVPLLDHRFVELAAHLPASWKYKEGVRKHIFKKLMEPYLPADVLNRQKEGFGAPLSLWLENGVRELLENMVKNGSLRSDGYLDLNTVKMRDLEDWSFWKVACLEIWYRLFIKSGKSPNGVALKDL